MLRRKAPKNSRHGSGGDRIDGDGLKWLLGKIHEWRERIGDRTRVDSTLLGAQMLKLATCGIQECLLGFVILGCEWIFRLRSLRPADAQVVLARIEGGLRPVLHGDAWFVTEALAPLVRRLLKAERVLALAWEEAPHEVVVMNRMHDDDGLGGIDVGYVAALRTRPEPLIQARRGPAPKLAPWIAGAIAERIMDKQRPNTHLSRSEESDLIVQFISALYGELSRSLLNLAERDGRASYPQFTAQRRVPT